jgi:hypothetical protein
MSVFLAESGRIPRLHHQQRKLYRLDGIDERHETMNMIDTAKQGLVLSFIRSRSSSWIVDRFRVTVASCGPVKVFYQIPHRDVQ